MSVPGYPKIVSYIMMYGMMMQHKGPWGINWNKDAWASSNIESSS